MRTHGRDELKTYPGAGHLAGVYPYFPAPTISSHPLTGVAVAYGGSVAGDEAAQADGWARLLTFLASSES